MKTTYYIFLFAILSSGLVACSNDDDNTPVDSDDMMMMDDDGDDETPDFSGTFVQTDQMGRPAINTVFVMEEFKDSFNGTVPAQQEADFQAMFQANLEALSPAYSNPGDANALGLDAAAFTTLLATDVLNVSLDGVTTFFDGTNVLTGRALADDVITVELLLIFGGEDFMENPGLSDDNISENDAAFSSSFPYLASPW